MVPPDSVNCRKMARTPGQIESFQRASAFDATRALRILRHAAEYMIDNWMDYGEGEDRGVLEAVSVLMDQHSKIYCERPPRISLFARVLLWINPEAFEPPLGVWQQPGSCNTEIPRILPRIEDFSCAHRPKAELAEDTEEMLNGYAGMKP